MADEIETQEELAENSGPEWRGPSALRAFRHRDYALFWFGLFISVTGSWMQGVAQGWLVYELTKSELFLGIVGSAGTFPILVFSLPAGVLADRFSKRKIVIATQSAAMVQAAILAALFFLGLLQVWHIIILSIFGGIVGAIDIPARQSMTIELTGREDLSNAVALNSTAFNGARIIGPAIAGVLLSKYGAGMCFLINAISYFAIVAGLVTMSPKPAAGADKKESMLSQIGESVKYVLGNKLIKDLIIMTAMASIFALQYSTVMPALASKILHVGPKGYGMMMTMAGVGAFAGALAVASLGQVFKQGTIMVTGAFLTPIALFGIALTGNYYIMLAGILLIGFSLMMFLAVSNSVLQAQSPDKLRGRVVALRTLVFMGLTPIGSLTIGALSERIGVQESIFMGAVAFLATTLYAVLSSKAVRTAS